MNPRPDLQAITRELCEVARKNMPDAFEFIYHDAVGYSVSKSPFDRICYIAPQKSLCEFRLLLRCGDARNPALGKLVAATWKEAPGSIARIHAGRKKNKS